MLWIGLLQWVVKFLPFFFCRPCFPPFSSISDCCSLCVCLAYLHADFSCLDNTAPVANMLFLGTPCPMHWDDAHVRSESNVLGRCSYSFSNCLARIKTIEYYIVNLHLQLGERNKREKNQVTLLHFKSICNEEWSVQFSVHYVLLYCLSVWLDRSLYKWLMNAFFSFVFSLCLQYTGHKDTPVYL